jgi:uncharacterized protein with HEPN domain
MSKRGDRELLSDIRGAIERITSYLSGFDYDSFLNDNKTQDAVMRNLEILGEATKNLSEAVRTRSIDVPWKNMAGVRDRLIHDYFGVNLDIVWQISTVELPKIIEQLPDLDQEDETSLS